MLNGRRGHARPREGTRGVRKLSTDTSDSESRTDKSQRRLVFSEGRSGVCMGLREMAGEGLRGLARDGRGKR
jgi:hypothetical protein